MFGFRTIRETAELGILNEHRLRIMRKNGNLPGVMSGKWFRVDVDRLIDQLREMSAQEVTNHETENDRR